jgi:hypothetical protein
MDKSENLIIPTIINSISVKKLPQGMTSCSPTCTSKLIKVYKFSDLPMFADFNIIPEYKGHILIRDILNSKDTKYVLFDLNNNKIVGTTIISKNSDDDFGYFIICDKFYCYLFDSQTSKLKIISLFPFKVIIEYYYGCNYDFPLFYSHNDMIIVEHYHFQYSIKTFYIEIFDKNYSLIHKFEKFKIKCLCNNNIFVFSLLNVGYYLDINSFKFIDAGLFLQWKSDKAFEFDKNKIIIKNMTKQSKKKICTLCHKDIIDNSIYFYNNFFHKICLNNFKLTIKENKVPINKNISKIQSKIPIVIKNSPKIPIKNLSKIPIKNNKKAIISCINKKET